MSTLITSTHKTVHPEYRHIRSKHRLSVPIRGGYQILKIEDVVFMKSDSNYTQIYLDDGQILLSSRSLKVYEAKLAHMGFVKTHRSFLVPTNRIEFIDGQEHKVVLKSNRIIPMSREGKKVLSDIFGAI